MTTEYDWDRWVSEANDALASLSACTAKWWGFGPPCQTFQLVIGDPVGVNVALMLCNTTYLAGPTMWPKQAIRLSRHSKTSAQDNAVWLLEDVAVGFRAEAGDVFWAKNVEVCDSRNWRLWRPSPGQPGDTAQ